MSVSTASYDSIVENLYYNENWSSTIDQMQKLGPVAAPHILMRLNEKLAIMPPPMPSRSSLSALEWNTMTISMYDLLFRVAYAQAFNEDRLLSCMPNENAMTDVGERGVGQEIFEEKMELVRELLAKMESDLSQSRAADGALLNNIREIVTAVQTSTENMRNEDRVILETMRTNVLSMNAKVQQTLNMVQALQQREIELTEKMEDIRGRVLEAHRRELETGQREVQWLKEQLNENEGRLSVLRNEMNVRNEEMERLRSQMRQDEERLVSIIQSKDNEMEILRKKMVDLENQSLHVEIPPVPVVKEVVDKIEVQYDGMTLEDAKFKINEVLKLLIEKRPNFFKNIGQKDFVVKNGTKLFVQLDMLAAIFWKDSELTMLKGTISDARLQIQNIIDFQESIINRVTIPLTYLLIVMKGRVVQNNKGFVISRVHSKFFEPTVEGNTMYFDQDKQFSLPSSTKPFLKISSDWNVDDWFRSFDIS